MADTLPSETVTPEAPSNETGTTNTPPQVTVSADVEAAKKEAEQAKIRANQLANELAKIKADQEAAKAKQLEEKEEFKTLYEQTQSKLKEIEDANAEAERKTALEAATQDVFKDYPANVVELAKSVGLGLTDDSEASVQLLKEKLDAFKKQIVPSSTPGANNPHAPAPAAASQEELLKRMRGGDKTAVKEYINSIPAVQKMREQANS